MKVILLGRTPRGLRPAIRKLLACPLLPAKGLTTIKFVSPRTMSQYNRRFRGKEGPTDVLSFPFDPLASREFLGQADHYMGDILVCPRVVELDSHHLAVPVRVRLLKVVAHGVLHLLGMDHQTRPQAARMSRLENRLVSYALKE